MTEKTTMELLREPFDEKDYEWRVQSVAKSGKSVSVLCYVTNRAIMDRLDEVFGIENWKNEFKESPSGGVLCGISIKFDNEWITKWDGADKTDIEAVKGGLSSAMKRAGVQWGIGRLLYNLEASRVQLKDNGEHYQKVNNEFKYWDEPVLPDWAVRNRSGKKPPVEPETETRPIFMSPKDMFIKYVIGRAEKDKFDIVYNKEYVPVWDMLVSRLSVIYCMDDDKMLPEAIYLKMDRNSSKWTKITKTLQSDKRNMQEIING